MEISCKLNFYKKKLFCFLMIIWNLSSVFCVERIVSLSPSGTEIIFALGLGDKLVGRTDFCTFPEEAKKIDSVGGFDGKSFSLETILSFNPDFVYLTNGMHNHLITILESLNIEVYVSNVNSIEGIYEEIIDIARILNVENIGIDYVKKMKSEIDNVKVSSNNIYIYCEIFNSPFLTCGKKSFINDIINYAGGKNIFETLDLTYPQVSEENIILLNPEIILAPDYSNKDIEGIYNRVAWKNIDAVKNKKVYSVLGDIFTRPGPRVVDAIKILKEIIYEEQCN